MNEEINRIKKYLEEHTCVSLARQCSQEYIVYTYYLNYECTTIIKLIKEHFLNRDLKEEGKKKRWKIKIPVEKFLNDTIYDLITRGYKLEDWS